MSKKLLFLFLIIVLDIHAMENAYQPMITQHTFRNAITHHDAKFIEEAYDIIRSSSIGQKRQYLRGIDFNELKNLNEAETVRYNSNKRSVGKWAIGIKAGLQIIGGLTVAIGHLFTTDESSTSHKFILYACGFNFLNGVYDFFSLAYIKPASEQIAVDLKNLGVIKRELEEPTEQL